MIVTILLIIGASALFVYAFYGLFDSWRRWHNEEEKED